LLYEQMQRRTLASFARSCLNAPHYWPVPTIRTFFGAPGIAAG
jgi:hypothetical protein